MSQSKTNIKVFKAGEGKKLESDKQEVKEDIELWKDVFERFLLWLHRYDEKGGFISSFINEIQKDYTITRELK